MAGGPTFTIVDVVMLLWKEDFLLTKKCWKTAAQFTDSKVVS